MDRIPLFGRSRKGQFSLVAILLMVLLIIGFSAGGKAPLALAAPLGSSALVMPNHHTHYYAPPQNSGEQWGEITIAQPKVWQYERVNALLDGLLRDVEGVSLADLTRLDPNQQNAAAIRFVQSALGISVTYDQAAQVNASNTLQTFQAKHDSEVRQLDEYNNYMQGLTAQRDNLTRQLFSTNNEIVTLQNRKEGGGAFTALDADHLQAATDRAATLNAQLKDVNTMISGAGTAPTLSNPPTVTGTSATAPPLPSPSSLGDLLKSLPDSVQKSFSNALQSPTYPATKQLDSFITLLHERLAREISVMQDDLMRDPDTFAYLVQFDVGLYPSKSSKNHMARVEFDMVNCKDCKVYSLYPGQSSYNVVNYQGSSKRRSFMGNFATLIGLGISANYQRQEDALKGSLVQSVYVSGFQQDDENAAQEKNADHPGEELTNQHFGWYYNSAPFDEYVTPGIRSTFAIVTVPRETVRNTHKNLNGSFPLVFRVFGSWPPRNNPKEFEDSVKKRLSVALPATKDLIELPDSVTQDSQRLHVLRMEYNTVTLSRQDTAAAPSPTPTPTTAPVYASSNGCKKDECASILLTLDVPIDPNLVVTVAGSPLHRVRDWRGRATSVLPPVQSLSDIVPPPTGAPTPKSETVASRSLLETDQVEPNSWFALNSHDLLITISHDLAGEEIFPVIQIADPGKRTLVIPNDLRQNFTELMFDGFRLLPTTREALRRHIVRDYSNHVAAAPPDPNTQLMGGPFPYSTFSPIFMADPVPQKFYAEVGQTGEDLLIGFRRNRYDPEESKRYSFLEARTTVILEDSDVDLAWSLSCVIQGEELVCKLPIEMLRNSYTQILQTCTNNICGSLEPLIQAIRGTNNQISDTAFVSSLQVWVGQADPDGKNSFWSPEPAKIGLFPLGTHFIPAGRFMPWHFDPVRTTPDQFSIQACNYFGGNLTNARVRYLTPRDFPMGLIPDSFTVADNGFNCGSIPLPTFSLQLPEIVLQTAENPLPDSPKWTDAIPISRLRPQFGQPRIDPLFEGAMPGANKTRIAGWDIKIPVDRAHCGDAIDFSEDFQHQLQEMLNAARRQIGNRVIFEWLDGTTTIQPEREFLPVQIPSKLELCKPSWWQQQSTGRIQLHFTISKQALAALPPDISLVRITNDSVRIAVAQLPDLRKLILPSKLKVEPMGESQFALRGRNAGTIDAVIVQNGAYSHIFPAGTGSDFAVVQAIIEKPASAGPGKKPPTKEVKPPAGAPPPANPPVSTPAPSPVVPASSPTPTPTPASIPTPATGNNSGAGTNGGAKPNTPGNASKPSKILLEPGTYALVPVIYDGRNYIPIEVTDDQGKPLTFTVPAKKDVSKDTGTKEPDVTLTIAKTTKQATPTPSPSPTPTPAR